MSPLDVAVIADIAQHDLEIEEVGGVHLAATAMATTLAPGPVGLLREGAGADLPSAGRVGIPLMYKDAVGLAGEAEREARRQSCT